MNQWVDIVGKLTSDRRCFVDAGVLQTDLLAPTWRAEKILTKYSSPRFWASVLNFAAFTNEVISDDENKKPSIFLPFFNFSPFSKFILQVKTVGLCLYLNDELVNNESRKYAECVNFEVEYICKLALWGFFPEMTVVPDLFDRYETSTTSKNKLIYRIIPKNITVGQNLFS